MNEKEIKVFCENLGISLDTVINFVNVIRKETAKEIINMLTPDCTICDADWHKGCLCLREFIAEKIEKQFGVFEKK